MEALPLDGGILLRRPTTGDVEGLFAVHGDRQAYHFDPQQTHLDQGYTSSWLAPILQHWVDNGFGFWTVVVPPDWWPAGPVGTGALDAGGVIAGMGGIRVHLSAGRRVLNVYFRFAPPVQGRGLAGQVLSTAVSWASDNLPGTDLVVRTRPDNTAARRVAVRAGFVEDGNDPDEPTMVMLRLRQSTGSR